MGPRERLTAYLRSRSGGFAWGKRDCLTFTNDAWRAMYGHPWAQDWLGRYLVDGEPIGRKGLREAFGANSLHDALDVKLSRIAGPVPLGALVTIQTPSILRHAMGVSYGVRAAFLGESGVIYAPIDQITGAWRER